ncbi:hypothetical protein V1477_013205 [Vespula maculifrons]|uniref:Uncharacterized protein n=1 Tax=Vespula maculifrons TaxID=7453 RepID=A0ABD2BV96_VESMC
MRKRKKRRKEKETKKEKISLALLYRFLNKSQCPDKPARYKHGYKRRYKRHGVLGDGQTPVMSCSRRHVPGRGRDGSLSGAKSRSEPVRLKNLPCLHHVQCELAMTRHSAVYQHPSECLPTPTLLAS